MVTVSSGQTYTVPAGQTDTGDVVLDGGILDVLAGGTISNTIVNGGTNINTAPSSGIDNVFGKAIDTTVIAGAAEYVYGATIGTTLSGVQYGQAHQYVLSGGVVISTFVGNISDQLINPGGTAVDTQVNGYAAQQTDEGIAVSTTVSSEIGRAHV